VTIRVLLLVGGVSLALASVASAQSVNAPVATPGPPPAIEPPPTAPAPPPPAAAIAPPLAAAQDHPGLPPQRIHAIVRAAGFDPIGPPARRGNLYVQRAIDPDAMEYRLVIDPMTGRTLSVRPLRVAGPYRGPGYYGRPYPPPYRAAYGRYYGPPPDDFGYGPRTPRPPRAVPAARLSPPKTPPQSPPQSDQPPQQAHQLPPPQPTTTAQAPLPRPKPYVMEATGSIPVDAPKTPEPPKTPEQPAAPPQNGAAAMPPVAPLD
jgi:hypothetical protein